MTPTPNLKSRLLFIAFLSFIAIGLQGGALGVAWLYMQDTFGVTLESLGVLLTTFTLGSLGVSFYSGSIVGRIGVGMFCTVSAVVGLIGLVWTALTPTWTGLILAALLLGLGRSGINAGINTFIADAYPSSRMNWLHALFGVGSSLGPLLVTLLVAQWGQPWQLSYWVLAGVQVVVLSLFAATLPHWQLTPAPVSDSEPSGGPSMRSSLRLLPLWLGVVLFVSHTGLQSGAGQLTNNLFVEGRGVDPKIAGVWISLFWVFITLGRILFGALVDCIGTARLLRYVTFGTVIGALLLWWSPVDAVGFFGLGLMGFTLAPVFPSSVSRTPTLVGAYHSPNAIGVQMAGAALGGALVPGVIGYVGDNLGLNLIPPCLVAVALAQFVIHEFITREERGRPVAALQATD